MKKVHITPKDKSFNAQRPLYEVSLVRAVSLGAVMATLLSSVSPVFASHLSSTGATVQSVSAGVVSANVAHGRVGGSVGVANGNRSCGVDQVVSHSLSSAKKVSAEEQYKKLSANQQFINCDPNGSVIQPVTWIADTDAMFRAIAAGVNMRQVAETSEEIQGYFDSFTLKGIGAELGSNANAESGEDVAIGREAWAKGGGSVALGFSSQALQSQSIVIGNYAKAEGMKAIAIGSFAEAKLGTAVGYRARSSVEGGVALGDDSKAEVAKWVSGYDPVSGIASMETSPAWRGTTGAVSVGDVSNRKTRQITGVAAGFEETDAVNVAQLKALKTWVETEGGTWRLSVNGQNATKVNKDTSLNLVAGSDNIKIVKSGNTVTFDLNKDLVLTSIWTRNVRLIDAGLLIVNGPSVTTAGINAADMKVRSVADGILLKGSKDAINAGQVYELNSTVATYLGGNANVLESTAPTYTIQSQGYNNVGDAFTGVDTSLTRLFGKINDVVDSILVEQNSGTRRITIGAKTDGNEVSIANKGGESRILSGIKDGDLSAHSTEAVNGAQLYKVDESVKTLGSTVSKVEGKVTNLDTNVTKLNTNISEYLGGSANILTDKAPTYTIQSHEYGNVGSAFEGVDNALTQLFGKVENILVHQNPGTKVITVGKEVEGSEISIANKDRESRVLSGVKVGELSANSTEAVNGSQLYKLSSNISQYLGVGANILEDTVPTYTIQKQTHNDVGAAFAGVDASLTQLSSRIDDVVGSDLVQQEQSTHKITIGAKVGGSEIIISNGDGVSRKLTGLKNGEVTEDSTDAVNGSQLHEVKQSVDVLTGTVSGVQENVTKLDTNINKYLGGSADVLNGTPPTYRIQDEDRIGVAAAFEGVDDTLTQLSGKIDGVANVLNNGLVQQDSIFELITIGAKTGGTEVSIANANKESRKLTGLANGDVSENSTEAITGSQLHGVTQSVTNLHGIVLEVEKNVTILDANISEYLGGGANILENKAPTYTIQNGEYSDVEVAFVAVDDTLTQLVDRIDDVVRGDLVQQELGTRKITIGAKARGDEISIVNKDGESRTLSGVADGSVTEGSTEAVNGKQLHEVKQGVETLTNTVSSVQGNVIKLDTNLNEYLGGDANILNGIAPTYTIQKKDYHTVAAAFVGVDEKLTKLQNNINTNTTAVKENALFWSDEEEAFVALHVNKGEGRGVAENNKLKFLLDGDIIEGSTEAITGNQLYVLNKQLAAYFGGGAGYEDGKWTDPTFTITDFGAQSKNEKQAYHNVAEAFGAVNSSMSGLNDRIEKVEQQTSSQMSSDRLIWNNDKNAYDANHNGQAGKITDVADGAIKQGSSDAVTGNQLWETNEKIDNLENKVDGIISDISTITDGVVTYDKDEHGNKINSITLVGTDDDTPVLIDNVADGEIEEGSKQAVNGGQLKEQMSVVLADANKYTDEKIGNMVSDAVEQANAYTDMKFEALNYKVEGVQKEARQAAAIGLAVANLHYIETPGMLSIAFGSGVWRGQSALAFGAGYTSEDGDIRSNLSVTTSGGHWGVGAGISFTLN
ncbi:YadA-like family protein [Bartonella sp. WD12.1]|uniref:YadA-like family protein n=1 Tax=Bartonella sp. WD12.1 TaxID=1933903 RepID=UPI00099AE697|nr:YadA-like family protein [Bartonella sp. WD12.1]OPB29116.1 Coiled stalk of trimeric autotransporter adhesin [Bartonella sp. WD12.1]